MAEKVRIDSVTSCDIDEAINLWEKQFAYFCADKAIYPCWQNHMDSIEKYISNKAKQGNAFIARNGSSLVGFISFDIFNFHGTESAICHFCGNASAIKDRQYIYFEMYRGLCKYCVEKGVLAQYISICANDVEVKKVLFDLGFGAYGADGFTGFHKPLSRTSDYQIEVASVCETQAVYNVYGKSVDYFMESPICLRLDVCSMERIEEKIKAKQVYVAKDNGRVIGIFDIEIAENDNIYRMYTKGCGVVCGEMGVYILDEYRGKGIGSQFIQTASEYCIENNIQCAHVPWETANPDANRFWRKFFTPTVLALKRTLHFDVLG